ncbi:MAG TPA: TerB family tellurite resistance protein [Candidatus Limnocylindrales bacterium]|jgi:uncharacterized tellurite resistance protein B-like protein|nr:TerB family tellurite resistance protein [Candidatus Limnocylindrales bacterium]
MSYLRRFMGLPDAPRPEPRSDGESETIRRIVGQLEAMPPDRATFVAGFAYILSRVANADLEMSQAETDEMEALLEEVGGLSAAEAVLVVGVAKTQQRLEGGTQDYIVTRRFAQSTDREQQKRLLQCAFEVASAGDSISAEENASIRQISDELDFTIAELNEVRARYADRMSVVERVAEAARERSGGAGPGTEEQAGRAGQAGSGTD